MRRVFGIALGLGVIAVLGWVLFFRGTATSGPGKPGGKGGRHEAFDGPVPVAVGEVRRQDVPVYLDGLGTVQAFNTVTVRPQVDGKLVSVQFREGQEVRAGDVLAQIDPRSFQAQLDQALAKKAQDEALLSTAKRDLDRYTSLVPDGYVSKQQLDTQRQTAAQFDATVKADDAAIQSAKISLDYTRVTSPISGVTGLRLVDVGNLVQAASSTGLVIVTQVKPISVVFTLPEQNLSAIRAAGGEGLSVVALDRDNQKPVAQGELSVVDNQIDQTTGTIKLKATFPNTDKALWPGQFVNIRLLVRTEKNGLVVPSNAVQRGADGEFVYVANGDAAEKRDVHVTLTEAGVSLIGQGLSDGEKIVVDGQYRLQPGSKIQVAGAEAAPAEPAAGADAADAGKGEHRRRRHDGGAAASGSAPAANKP